MLVLNTVRLQRYIYYVGVNESVNGSVRVGVIL